MDADIVWRVLVAVALATLIGAEREAAGQPAGLRTHVTVALGACLFGMISTLGFQEFYMRRELTNVQVDVTRVASNVVVGIGFLGAGLIFRAGGKVRNLTTAASIWSTAAVGLAAGVGNFAAATATTVAMVGALVLLRPVRTLIVRTLVHERRDVTILVVAGADPTDVLDAARAIPGIAVDAPTVTKEDGAPLVRLRLSARPGVDLGGVVTTLAARDDVRTLRDEQAE